MSLLLLSSLGSWAGGQSWGIFKVPSTPNHSLVLLLYLLEAVDFKWGFVSRYLSQGHSQSLPLSPLAMLGGTGL